MTQEQLKLTKLLASKLFGGGNAPEGFELSADILEEAKAQAVLYTIADDAAAQFMVQNMRVLNEHVRLHELLTENGIPYVIIKGWASSYYYPEPIRRHLGDVDFFVRLEDRARTSELLIKSGYRLTEDINPHHWSYRHDRIELELHWRLNGAPDGEPGDIIADHMADVFDRSVLVSTDVGQMRIPSDFHNGLIMLLHMARHMTSSGMGLRHVCDWAVFVNRIDDFEAMFKECFTRLGLWHYACIMTRICEKYLGLPKQAWAEAEEIPDGVCEAAMEDLCEEGNMGKSMNIAYDHFFLPDITEDPSAKSSGKFGSFTASLNRVTRNAMPVVKKFPALMPVGWLYVGVRYIFRVARGKRKMINVTKAAASAGKRGALYDEFRLFEKWGK